MATAKSNGTYKDANGNEFVIREGDELPEGATFSDGDELAGEDAVEAFDAEKAEIVEGTLAQPVVRSNKSAPQNKARNAATETKSL